MSTENMPGLEQLRDAIDESRMDDTAPDWLESPQWCRPTAEYMRKIARLVEARNPSLHATYVMWPPEARGDEESIHYAIQATERLVELAEEDGNESTWIYNINATSQFPQYIGPKEYAPGKLGEMVPVEDVK